MAKFSAFNGTYPFFKFLCQRFQKPPVQENALDLHVGNDSQERHLKIFHQTHQIPCNKEVCEELVEPEGYISILSSVEDSLLLGNITDSLALGNGILVGETLYSRYFSAR